MKAYIQGKDDPAPGYFVSTTALVNKAFAEENNPKRYVDATAIPYIVYADSNDQGKLATVVDLRDENNPVYHHAVAADYNGSTDGEASLYLGGLFGFSVNDARGTGSEERKFCYIIYDRVLGFPVSVTAINTPAQALYDKLPKGKHGVPCACKKNK